MSALERFIFEALFSGFLAAADFDVDLIRRGDFELIRLGVFDFDIDFFLVLLL